MKVTLENKVPVTVQVAKITNTTNAISSGELTVGLNNLVDVDISLAEQGTVLMLAGTKWEAKPLDGGTFN